MVFGGAGSGFSNPVVSNDGGITRPQFESDNYVPGVSGWAIFRNGNVEFNSGTFRGTVTGGAFQGSDFVLNTSGLFLYSGTPALGNLVYSVAQTSGTDAFGNVYTAIQQIGITGQPNITFGFNAGLGSGTIRFNPPGFFSGGLDTYAAPTFGGMEMFSPASKVAGMNDYVNIFFNSSDGVSSSANLELSWYDSANVDHQMAYMDYTGFNIQAGIATARDPTTGTSKANPAQNEGWHGLTCDGTWTLVKGPFYRLSNDGVTVKIFGAITHAAFSATTNINSVVPLPAPYRPNTTWNVSGTGIPGRAGVEVTSAGVFIAVPGTATCTECDFAGEYPLGV